MLVSPGPEPKVLSPQPKVLGIQPIVLSPQRQVHEMLEKMQRQMEADDDGGVMVADVLESMVSLQAAHR